MALCSLLGHEGLSGKVYLLTGEVLKKLASVASSHRKFFIVELSELAHSLSSSAISELITLRTTQMLGLSLGSMAGAAVLRILQTLSSLTVADIDDKGAKNDDYQEHVTMWKLNLSLETLWQELSKFISVTESQLAQGSMSSVMSNVNTSEHLQGTGASSPPLPPGTQRLLPFIVTFLVLCEKLQASSSLLQQDDASATTSEVKKLSGSSSPSAAGVDGAVTFSRFAEKHRRLLNAFVRQNPGLLEKSLSMMLKAPRLIDFDNKRSYFRSRIRQQHDQHLTGPLRISVRRAYVLEDSYNQLRMRPTQDLKGRLNVHFQGEEGVDAGGLTREWYQLLSRVIHGKVSIDWWQINSISIATLHDAITLVDAAPVPSSLKNFFDVVVQTTLWYLRRFRNDMIFARKRPNKQLILSNIKLSSHNWITFRQKKTKPNWIEWICNLCIALSEPM